MKCARLLIPILVMAVMLCSCGNTPNSQERENFVRDSIANAERTLKEKELFGDLYLGMSKEEVLNSQFFRGSIRKPDNWNGMVLENNQGFDVNIDSLHFKFIHALVGYKTHDDETVREFTISSEPTYDYRTLIKDVTITEKSLCNKYGFAFDEYKSKMLDERLFSHSGAGYPYREYEYGKKKITILLHRASSEIGPYRYEIKMSNVF